MKITVVGLGKLGAPMVACFAERGHEVVGMDVDPEAVELLRVGRAKVREPGLEQLLKRNRSRIKVTSDFDEAVSFADIIFVIVPTPSAEDGNFSLDHVLSVMGNVGPLLDERKLVVLVSTVLPGSCENEIVPALERASRVPVGFCYNPSFIALGSVVRDLLNPRFVLIGQRDERSGDLLSSFYRGLVGGYVPVARMGLANAELTKIAVNAFVTMKISFANTLAEICENMPGGDGDPVTRAVGLDGRIGSEFFTGGTGFGGPCFPRDNRAFRCAAGAYGVPSPLSKATDEVNERQTARLAAKVRSSLPGGGTVGILGLSYKPGTPVLEESPALALARALDGPAYRFVGYDKLARDMEGIAVCGSAQECADRSDLLVVMHPDFGGVEHPNVADCWRVSGGAAFAVGRHHEVD